MAKGSVTPVERVLLLSWGSDKGLLRVPFHFAPGQSEVATWVP